MSWVGGSPELACIHNSVAKLDHGMREIAAVRSYEIPANAIHAASERKLKK